MSANITNRNDSCLASMNDITGNHNNDVTLSFNIT